MAKKTWFMLFFLVVGVGCLIWILKRGVASSVSTVPVPPGATAPQAVELFEVSSVRFTDSLEGLVGTVKGDTIELAFTGSEEPLTAVHVTVGQRVNRGDLLFEMDHDRAKARREQAESALERADALFQAGASTARDRKEAQASFDIARRDYEDTFIRAPKSGDVTQVNKQVGEIIGRGEVLGTLVSNQDKLFVETGVIEGKVDRVRAGQKAKVWLGSGPGDFMEGHVMGVSREVTTTGRTGTVLISLPDNRQKKLRPGLSVRCQILTFDKDTMIIPFKAWNSEKNSVMLRDEASGETRWVPVELGESFADHHEVLSGLKAGDLVVNDLVADPVAEGTVLERSVQPKRFQPVNKDEAGR